MDSRHVSKVFDWTGVIAIILTVMATISLAVQVVDLSHENDLERTRLQKLEKFQTADRANVCAVVRPLRESSDPKAQEAARIAFDIYRCAELTGVQSNGN